jgi:hypothetical protein
MRPLAHSALALTATALAACASSPRAASPIDPAPAATTVSSTTTTTTTTTSGGGAFVVRLGADTLAVERFTRVGNRVEGDVVNRSPAVRVTHYVVDLDAAGRPTRVQYASRRPDGGPLPNTAKGVTMTFRNDSAFAEVLTAADTVVRTATAAPGGALPPIANSYAMFELGLARLRAANAADGAIVLWAPGAPQPTSYKVTLSGDGATMEYFGDPVAIRTDAQGRILSVDGTRSTNKVLVERVTTLDVPAIAAAFAARGALGSTSPRDTARATVGAARLWIDYGRPSVRGRTVWGGTLVPFDVVWRTGANAATQLSTSADLVIGGATVPAGTYTLFTLPSAQGYQLIVNRQTGQWGTEYKPDQDVARVPLTVTPLSTPVEQFTFAIDPTPNGGTIRMSWGDRALSVPFTVRQ